MIFFVPRELTYDTGAGIILFDLLPFDKQNTFL